MDNNYSRQKPRALLMQTKRICLEIFLSGQFFFVRTIFLSGQFFCPDNFFVQTIFLSGQFVVKTIFLSGHFFCPDIFFVRTKGHLPPSRFLPHFFVFFWTNGEASRLRVCYQRGLLHLVFESFYRAFQPLHCSRTLLPTC